jgi:hypothetical protein
MSKEGISVESILSFNEIDATSYRIGPSQVSQKNMIPLIVLLKRHFSTQSDKN